MSNLTLDGSTSFIGTEFIKLLATGSSNLATVQYVDDAIEQNGGGNGNVDLSNYYTQTETDNLLNNKLNVNNPQDIIGTLRIDSTNGNGKLIVHAVGAPNDEDFYVNGLSNLGGTLKAQVIQASSNIQTSQQIQSNTINTYSNSNMIIQRNAIPYITLDSQIVDDETVEKIILMKDVEFSGNLSLNTLSVDTLNTNALNDMVFNINTLGEMLRLEVGGTVRVPNTRSFLSQDIYLDNLRPLTFSNDVVLYGGNNANDAYEEYVRLDASAEKVNISKETKFENAIQLNQGQSIKWTNVFIREVQGATRPEFDLIVNGSTSHLRLWVNGAIKQAITNTTIACKVNIDAEQGLTVFTGQQLKTNTINSHTNSNLVLQRSGSTLITLNSSNQIQFSGDLSLPTSNTQYIRFPNCNIRQGVATVVYFDFNVDTATGQYRFFIDGNTILNLTPLTTTISNELHLSNALYIDTADKLTMRPSLEGGVNIFDIRNLHPIADNPMIRFRVGEGGGETIVCEMTNDAVSFQRNVIVGTAYELKTNAIDTVNDNDLVISRNNISFLTLDKFTEDTVEREAIICSKQLRANGNVLVNNLQINQFQSGVEYADFRLHNADSVLRFFVGNSTNPNFQITNANINLNRDTTIGSVKTNTINSNGDNDLVFQRNGTEIFKCETSAGIDNNDILNITPIGGGMSASNIYCNSFKNRTLTSDTVFYGANSAGDNRIEYMKWNRTDQSLDFNAPIDNTNIAVIGNIVDTTVSDERLKTNIQDVESNYCDCVKNVKIKTVEYKDEKYKKSDKYGFIAQHLQKHLPKEFDNIVKETKPKKDEGEAYLSINYMKLSVVLWGALQETLTKVEHLESSMYEIMEDIKELKGKKTTKPKAKAKSKTKSENK